MRGNTLSVFHLRHTHCVTKSADESDFWRRLMDARKSAPKRLGLRQEDVAKSTGKRQSAVTKWKTGKALPTTDTVRVLAAEAGVSFDWLLTGNGTMRPASHDPEIDILIGYWRDLDLAGREHVMRTARLEWTARTVTTAQQPIKEKNHAGSAVHENPSRFIGSRHHR
jgi:transcriptional regulator with XRE-family HTH domain